MNIKELRELINNDLFQEEDSVVVRVQRGSPAIGSAHTTEVTGARAGFNWDSGKVFLTLKEEVAIKDEMTKAAVRLLDKCMGSYSLACSMGDKRGLARTMLRHVEEIMKQHGWLERLEKSTNQTKQLREKAKQARKKNKTPWSEETIEKLRQHQKNPMFHPYTCGNDSSHRNLVPTKDGWICLDCDYTQNWCH